MTGDAVQKVATHNRADKIAQGVQQKYNADLAEGGLGLFRQGRVRRPQDS